MAPTPVEAKIDKRIELLRDSVELKLNKDMDALLKSRLETAARIFTAFGIKTILDVKEIARTTAIAEVKKTLSIDDPNSDFRRDIDKVVARGLIDSYLLSLAKSKQDRFADDLSISETDFRRLQNLVTDPQSNTKDFSDAIEVLTKSSPRTQNEAIDRLIIALASGSDTKYKWIIEQPEKRAALFALYAR